MLTLAPGARRRQGGLSLVELMVSILIGLIVVSGVIAVMVNSLESSRDTLKASRLDQELRAVMDLFVRDLRRAGYRGNAATYIGAVVAGTDYSNTVVISEGGERVDFSYDIDRNGSFGETEIFAFRLSEGTVQMMRNGTGNWVTLTTQATTEVTTLSFCFWPSDDDACPTEPPDAGRVTVSGSSEMVIKDIRIELSARLRADPSVQRRLREVVRVRNDEFLNP